MQLLVRAAGKLTTRNSSSLNGKIFCIYFRNALVVD